MLVYLDSSMIVKRYFQEDGTDIADFLFDQAGKGNITLAYYLLSIGEVLGVLDHHLHRNWINKGEFSSIMAKFTDEALRLIKLNRLRVILTSSSLQMKSWKQVLTKRFNMADFIQLSSHEDIKADCFVTADKHLAEAAASLGIEVYTMENGKKLISRIQE